MSDTKTEVEETLIARRERLLFVMSHAAITMAGAGAIEAAKLSEEEAEQHRDALGKLPSLDDAINTFLTAGTEYGMSFIDQAVNERLAAETVD